MSDITSNIYALNFDGQSSPGLELMFGSALQAGSHTLGWGLGWYPEDGAASFVLKDPAAQSGPDLQTQAFDRRTYRSTTYFCKVQGATHGYTHRETQPFARSFAGRDWMFMHNGDLDRHALADHHTNRSEFLEPLGRTDSELAFCTLLGKVQECDARALSDVPNETLLDWFRTLDTFGNADICLSDRETLVCYRSAHSVKGLYYGRMAPPNRTNLFTTVMATITFPDARDAHRTMVVVSSSPMTPALTPLQSGQLIIVKRGYVVWQSDSVDTNKIIHQPVIPTPPMQPDIPMPEIEPEPEPVQPNNASFEPHQSIINVRSLTHAPDGQVLHYKMYDVSHTSNYGYDIPVQHSTHRFHLQPIDDRLQEVVDAKLTISVAGEEIQYEDVFGNQSIHYSIHTPYTFLSIKSTSRIKIYETPPDDFRLSRRDTLLPLRWMPWQHQMMMPYLLPAELPETQLEELSAYALSFAERNKHHLMDTLKDINTSIYRDYQYTPGSTSLNTTPFEVYSTRRGVCQDFANLFICMARLLGVPARYQMGYIYTGTNYENTIQSEASHAWVELYLPFIGWRGFDPTNGCLTAQEHIRVACGRQYQDATPISGTIFRGGGGETVTVDVKLEEVVV